MAAKSFENTKKRGPFGNRLFGLDSTVLKETPIYLARANGKIVGYVMVSLEGKRMEVAGIGVHPNLRRMGLGRKLVNHVEQVYLRKGFSNGIVFHDTLAGKNFFSKLMKHRSQVKTNKKSRVFEWRLVATRKR